MNRRAFLLTLAACCEARWASREGAIHSRHVRTIVTDGWESQVSWGSLPANLPKVQEEINRFWTGWGQGRDSNPRSLGYEPSAVPTRPPCKPKA